MTVHSVRVEQMPMAESTDGQTATTIPELYEDLLVGLFAQHLERANEYLDEVRPSEWDFAPDTPEDFKDLLSDRPYTDGFDDEKESSGGTARPEFEDWPDDMLTFAKRIEEEYGVEGDKFTYDDLKDLDGVPYKDSSIPVKMGDFKDEDFVTDSGDREGGKKLWVWVKSWDKDKSQQDPVTDGGFNEFDWEDAIETMADGDPIRDEDRDWFTEVNFPAFVDVYRHIGVIDETIRDIREIRDWAEWQDRELDEDEVDRVESKLEVLKREFQDAFSTLHTLVDVAHSRIATWAEKYDVDLHNELDRFRPHKKQDRQLQRLEAKRFAVIDTHLSPLLKYTHYIRDPTKLRDVEEVVDAFLLWMWVLYEDATVHVDDEDPTTDVPIVDTVKDVLKTEHDAPSDDNHIPWTNLVKVVQHDHPDTPRPSQIFTALQDLHKRGKADNTTDWRGLHVYDDADVSEDPELMVEIVYSEFGRVHFDESKWSNLMRNTEV